MPELPEVETTRRGIEPHILGKKVSRVIVRESRLRWLIPDDLGMQFSGQTIQAVTRRAKYLLLHCSHGCAIVHLGMSGSLRIVPTLQPAGKHDHVDIVFDHGLCLRLHDPRRFGALIWTGSNPLHHDLLAELGPEPLEDNFTGTYLYQRSRHRSLAVKHFIMDSRILVGVGNIYANEALFLAGINPARAAGRVSQLRYEGLAKAIKQVLNAALLEGGTTLRDFHASDGTPGYFRPRLCVYSRANLPCTQCTRPLKLIRQGQRASYYCGYCQR